MKKIVLFFKKLPIVLGIMGILLASCEDNLEKLGGSPDLPLEDNISTNNGRLVFNSIDNLNSFIETAKEEQDFEKYKQNLKPFENGKFSSLLPLISENEMQKSAEYLKFRKSDVSRIRANNPIHEAARGSREDDFDINEDMIIADSYFAALLNRKREIQVENKVYRYTEYGILYTDVSNANELESADTKLTAPKQLPCKEPYAITNTVYFIQPNCGGGGGGGFGGGTTTPTKPDISDLKLCNWNPNFWDDVFGPAQSCIDKFSKHRRIKTKAWAQNYGIFASVGIKVESQKRTLGIWWAHKIDEVELGYTVASFKYPDVKIEWPKMNVDFHYEYNGYIVDQNGNYIGQGTNSPLINAFESFPIKDPSKRLITIYAFRPIKDIVKDITGKDKFEVTGKDFNNFIKDLIKDALGDLNQSLNGELTSAVIVSPGENNEFIFFHINWSNNNKNDNKIATTFDWNSATIGFKSKGSSTKPLFDIASSYKEFRVLCYGMGRDGNTWKGSRVQLEDVK